jgi:molybdopterin-dependent oxidoreductase alpha subunit
MALGGFHSIAYVLKKARLAGGLFAMRKAMRTKNACKTCAFGMGGQKGGMVNELDSFPEFCKKSIQAMAADMQGEITKEFFEDNSIARLSSLSSRELEKCGRLTFPVFAGPLDLHYKPISWDEALRKVSKSIRETQPKRSFYYCSGRSSNEAGFLLQLAARVRGTNNVNNCSYYCHQASGVGLTSVTGSGTATVQLSDLKKCDLMFLIGCNPSSNHPRLLKSLVDLRRRGGKVIVINPLREEGLCKFKVPSDIRSLLFGSKISDLYVQPNIGGDSALLIGIIKQLDENDLVDNSFVSNHVDGFEEVLQQARELTWETIVEKSGVEQTAICEIANIYASSSKTIFCWAMGITHVLGGVDGVRMIANLAMARGMLGKEGAGLLPLRGHSNVQGMGSVGVVPVLNKSFVRALESKLNLKLPSERGLDTMASMEAASRGEIDYAMCLGGNLVGSNPDTRFAVESMAKVKLVSYMSTTLNQGHFVGRGQETIILPVLARDEEQDLTTQESMFNYVRHSSGGQLRHIGPRSEVDVVVDIASNGIGVLDWEMYRNHKTIRTLLASCLKGFDENKETHIKGRTFHKPEFATDNGKAKAHKIVLHERKQLRDNELRLMTIRSEGQFNTVVYEEEDIFRGQTKRDIVMMSAFDINRLGLQTNQKVVVRGTSGELEVTVREVLIASGNCAMYFPEANVLLSHNVDKESRTPLFKGEVVEIIG